MSLISRRSYCVLGLSLGLGLTLLGSGAWAREARESEPLDNNRDTGLVLPESEPDLQAGGLNVTLSLPPNTVSVQGDYAMYIVTATPQDGTRQLSLQFHDDYAGPGCCHHIARIQVNRRDVWFQDVWFPERSGTRTVDLSAYTTPGVPVTLSIQLIETHDVDDFPVNAQFLNVRFTGFGNLPASAWTYQETNPAYSGSIQDAARVAQ